MAKKKTISDLREKLDAIRAVAIATITQLLKESGKRANFIENACVVPVIGMLDESCTLDYLTLKEDKVIVTFSNSYTNGDCFLEDMDTDNLIEIVEELTDNENIWEED